MDDPEKEANLAFGPPRSPWSAAVVARYLIVVVGALAITAGLLLFMGHAANGLRRIDPLRYFAVADFISAPGGRRKPQAPPKPEAQPARPGVSYDTPTGRVPEDEEQAATPDLSVAPAPVPVEPELDAPPE